MRKFYYDKGCNNSDIRIDIELVMQAVGVERYALGFFCNALYVSRKHEAYNDRKCNDDYTQIKGLKIAAV